MTTADLVKPPAWAGQSGRLSSGARLAWLYARSRRVPAAVLFTVRGPRTQITDNG